MKTIGLNNCSEFTRSLRRDLSNDHTLSRPITKTEMVEKQDLFGERMMCPKGGMMKDKYPFQLDTYLQKLNQPNDRNMYHSEMALKMMIFENRI